MLFLLDGSTIRLSFDFFLQGLVISSWEMDINVYKKFYV